MDFMDETAYRKGITYLSREAIRCPVCGSEFFQEKLQSGGGRLIAGELTDFLHRLYKPSQKFGNVYPLIYTPVVCPDCFYSSLPQDFLKVPADVAEELQSRIKERMTEATKLIGMPVDFSKARTLESGAVGYVLAMQCYDFFPAKKFIPVIKQALCSIKAAFLFEDLNKEHPDNYYDFVSTVFYKKALFLYQYAIELNQSKQQIMEEMKVLGPDLDKDYGYDGVTFLIATLLLRYGDTSDPEVRAKDLEEAKLYYGKIFGMGKSDVNKPQELLNKARDFYDEISKLQKAAESECQTDSVV